MKRLSEKEFMARKNSESVIIYGSGSSINKLTQEDKEKLMLFDSIGFN